MPACRAVGGSSGPADREPAEVVRTRVAEELGFPCFVKPCNLGSSVGVAKARDPRGSRPPSRKAAALRSEVIVEEAIDARELECGVLGNGNAEASVVGELIPSHEFYDYVDKYVDGKARIVIPAEIPGELAEAVRELAVRAFAAIDCSGLARVDFFLEHPTGRLLLNEINTMPGFTAAASTRCCGRRAACRCPRWWSAW